MEINNAYPGLLTLVANPTNEKCAPRKRNSIMGPVQESSANNAEIDTLALLTRRTPVVLEPPRGRQPRREKFFWRLGMPTYTGNDPEPHRFINRTRSQRFAYTAHHPPRRQNRQSGTEPS